MKSVQNYRKIDPSTVNLSDEELVQLCDDYREIIQLAFESWIEQKSGSKNPIGVLMDHDKRVS